MLAAETASRLSCVPCSARGAQQKIVRSSRKVATRAVANEAVVKGKSTNGANTVPPAPLGDTPPGHVNTSSAQGGMLLLTKQEISRLLQTMNAPERLLQAVINNGISGAALLYMDPQALHLPPFSLSYLEVDYLQRVQTTYLLFQQISEDKFMLSMPLEKVTNYLDAYTLPELDRKRLLALFAREERVDNTISFSHFFTVAPLLRDVLLPHTRRKELWMPFRQPAKHDTLQAVWPNTSAATFERSRTDEAHVPANANTVTAQNNPSQQAPWLIAIGMGLAAVLGVGVSMTSEIDELTTRLDMLEVSTSQVARQQEKFQRQLTGPDDLDALSQLAPWLFYRQTPPGPALPGVPSLPENTWTDGMGVDPRVLVPMPLEELQAI